LRASFSNAEYQSCRQQDAGEFIKWLLNELTEKCAMSTCSTLFGGATCTTIHCNQCGCLSKSNQEFLELSLSIPDEKDIQHQSANTSMNTSMNTGTGTGNGTNSVSLLFLLNHFQETELLEKENRYRCSSEFCNSNLVESATRTTTVVEWPSHLVISLKRFYYSRLTNNVEKNLQEIKFDKEMVVAQGRINYRLYGVIVHLGTSASSGHYVAYVKHSSEAEWSTGSSNTGDGNGDGNGGGNGDYPGSVWWRCDDDTIEKCNGARPWERKENWKGATPYMLLYKRQGGGTESVAMHDDKEGNDGNGENQMGLMEMDDMEDDMLVVSPEGSVSVSACNGLSVPKECVNEIKKDNVTYMLSLHHAMLSEMNATRNTGSSGHYGSGGNYGGNSGYGGDSGNSTEGSGYGNVGFRR